MAWYYPHHRCGHSGERIQLYGKGDDRQRTLNRMANHLCPACRAAEAQTQAKDAGMPVLTGSEKQVGWASDIRAKAITDLRERVGGEQAERIIAALIPHATAKWWIDNRYDLVGAVRGLITEATDAR